MAEALLDTPNSYPGSPSPGSLERFLELMEDALPRELVPYSSVTAARAVARWFPETITSRLGFESRLHESDGRADLLFCVTAHRGEREALVGWTWPQNVTALADNDVWQRLNAFAREWACPASLVQRHLSNVWFEFDLDQEHSMFPTPSIFFGLEDSNVTGEPALAWRQQTLQDGRAVARVLAVLQCPASAKLAGRIGQCFTALPLYSKIFQVGLMLARSAEGVRVCVRRLPTGMCLDYLQEVGWSGSFQEIGTILEELPRHADLLCLDLDVGADGLLPSLGIECSFAAQPTVEPRWRTLLEFVSKLGLCRPEKASAFLGWAGTGPTNGRPGEVLVRAVSHVKLAYQPGGLVEAKVYFGGWKRLTAAAFLGGAIE